MQPFLILASGQRVPVTHGMTIGRVAGNDVVVDDAKASRRHARIHCEGGVCEIEDLGSSNGTVLNGKPVQRRLLRDGDRIQIGQTGMVFHEGSAAAAGTAAGDPGTGDDVDLFAAPPAVAPVPPAPAPAPPARPPAAAPTAASPPAAPPPPAPPRPPAVVEFADEVIEVRPQPKTATGAGSGATTVQQKQRVLQFSPHKESSSSLGDDLSQASPAYRALVFALVLACAAGLFWLIVQWMA